MNRLGDTPSCLLVNTRLNLWEQKPGCAGGQPLPRASVHPECGLHLSGTGKRGCSAELAGGGHLNKPPLSGTKLEVASLRNPHFLSLYHVPGRTPGM